MKLSALMAGKTPSATFEGFATADDMVLAVDCSAEQNADVGDYAIVQVGAKSVTASLNPETTTSAYIRAGKSDTKTGNQRTISFELDKYHGDEFQDYADSIKYATGQAAIVNYVYFSILTGKGEKGQATLVLDTDGSGNAEENLAISGSLNKSGAAPEAFTWGGSSSHTASVTFSGEGITDVAIAVNAFGTEVDETAGTYVFTYDGTDWKLDSTTVTLSDYGITVTGTAADGDIITVVYR
jgi:hypothetical protein